MLRFLILFYSALLFSSNITPIPLHVEYDKQKAELGKKLFFDPILSKDKTISCASCHSLPGNGADVTAYSFGVNGTEGNINSPTVLNSSFNFVQFWDGRAKDLKEQALEPIINPVEMADTIPSVLKKLELSSYKEKFSKIYKDGISEENLADVIAEFEKALFTPNSRFDKYLRGDKEAINTQEKRGYELFEDLGCISCHNGVLVGGNSYHKIGLFSPYKQDKPLLGRYSITLRERDKHMYKVPSLRNIELTAPYFHDGGAKTLKTAINFMQVLQLGISPKQEDTEDIEAFLKTLTGKSPKILEDLNEN
jgi:cytochrome c peroxidase